MRKYRTKRRGSVYLAVLGVAMIVSIIGMCSMQLSRLELRAAADRQAHSEARFLAQSGVEYAVTIIDAGNGWRGIYANGKKEPATPMAIGNGTFQYKLTDPADGNLNNGSNHLVEIAGIGKVGNATFVYVADYAPNSEGDMALVPGSWRQTTN